MKKYFMFFVAFLIFSLTLSLLFFNNDYTQVIERISVNQLSKVQSTFEEIRANENDEYFDKTIKFTDFDLTFDDGTFVNLSFTILQSEYGRKSKDYGLLNSGKLIGTDSFEGVNPQYIPSEVVYEFFKAVDNTKLLDVLSVDKTKNINFIYRGKMSFTEDYTQKKDVYIIKNNKLEILVDEHLNSEEEYFLFHVRGVKRVFHVVI